MKFIFLWDFKKWLEQQHDHGLSDVCFLVINKAKKKSTNQSYLLSSSFVFGLQFSKMKKQDIEKHILEQFK